MSDYETFLSLRFTKYVKLSKRQRNIISKLVQTSDVFSCFFSFLHMKTAEKV